MAASTAASRDFSRTTLAALRRRGVAIYGATFLPDSSGSYLRGERGYKVDDNGTGRVLTFRQVLAEAGR